MAGVGCLPPSDEQAKAGQRCPAIACDSADSKGVEYDTVEQAQDAVAGMDGAQVHLVQMPRSSRVQLVLKRELTNGVRSRNFQFRSPPAIRPRPSPPPASLDDLFLERDDF